MERVMMMGMASVFMIGQAAFAGMPLISSDAFVRLSVDSPKMTLPDAAPIGTYSGGAQLELRVTSNRPYQVQVGFSGFDEADGSRAFRPQDIHLLVNRVAIPVGRFAVPVFASTRTPEQGVVVPLDFNFQVNNIGACPAGEYSGGVTVAIAVAR